MRPSVDGRADVDADLDSQRPRQVRAVGAIGVCLLVLVGTVAVVLHSARPRVFAPPTSGYAATLAVGRETSVSMSTVRPGTEEGTVTVDSARPVVASDTTGASWTVRVCRPAARYADRALDDQQLRRACRSLRSADGATMRVTGDRPDKLVLTVAGRRPGTVRVDGLRVSYRYGWRHGTQVVGRRLRLRVSQ